MHSMYERVYFVLRSLLFDNLQYLRMHFMFGMDQSGYVFIMPARSNIEQRILYDSWLQQ